MAPHTASQESLNMVKKITAPHSYDPGKGRPKEYLAYLNEREMAYLRSINGNNMERGPRGLPSFPPEDAIGSSSNAPSKSATSSGAGRESSRGLGQGAGGAAVGRGPSGPSGGLGGGGKGPGGPSGPNSSPSRSGGPSTGGGGKGPGGPSGPNSAPSGTRGVGGPSSPMGGQGQSFRSPMGAGWANRDFIRDTIDRQKAQVNAARGALNNSPAVKGDLAVGGIRTLNVGPMGLPVSVGRPIPPSVSSYQSPIKPNVISSSVDKFIAAPEGMFGPRSGIKTPNYIKSASQPGFITSGMVSDYSGFPRASYSGPEPTIGTYTGRENLDLSGSAPPEKLSIGPDRTNTETTVFKDPEERILKIENVPDDTRIAAGTYTSPYDRAPQNRVEVVGGTGIMGIRSPEAETTVTAGDLTARQRDSLYGARQSDKTRGIGGGEPSLNNEFSGIESSGEIVREGEFGYPTNADGSPITAEDIANMPEDIQKEYFDKVRYSRNYDTPYPLTKAEKEKGYVAGAIGSLFKRGAIGAALKIASVVPGEFGDAAEKLSNVRKTVNAYDRLDPLKKQQMRERAGKGRGFGGGSTSTTSPGGGITDIGSGGKNEPPRISPVEKEAPKPPTKPKEGGPRPSIYYKWDLGVDVPSPTDSDYTLYLKYLQEKAAAKAGFA